MAADSGAFVALKRKPSEYLRDEHVGVDELQLPARRVHAPGTTWARTHVLGTDYPYGKMDECIAFLEGRGLSDAEKEMLYEKNAAALGVKL